MRPAERPQAFVGVWGRGGGKSSSAELGCAALGARGARRYALYVSGTQRKADDHVASVADLLESEAFAGNYPWHAQRKLGKHGNAKGWRRNRLWTAGGFVVDALGLDVDVRGVKLGSQRPDLIVLDDVDHRHDSPAVTRKKIEVITESLLPAGSADLAVLAIQNLIHADSVFAQLADGRAQWLRRRIVSGPIPALTDATYTTQPDGRVLINGTPTWEGQNLPRCQAMLDDMGPRAFRRECQHEVDQVEGAQWRPEQLDTTRRPHAPARLDRVVVAVDPAGALDSSSNGQHDDVGIITAARSGDHGYVLADHTVNGGPALWGAAVARAVETHQADAVVVEANFGGGMAQHVVEQALHAAGLRVPVRVVRASRGKAVRAEPVAALFGDPDDPDTWPHARAHLVGSLPSLEAELCRWTPDAGWSPGRLDALVWALTDLLVTRRPAARNHFRA